MDSEGTGEKRSPVLKTSWRRVGKTATCAQGGIKMQPRQPEDMRAGVTV